MDVIYHSYTPFDVSCMARSPTEVEWTVETRHNIGLTVACQDQLLLLVSPSTARPDLFLASDAV